MKKSPKTTADRTSKEIESDFVVEYAELLDDQLGKKLRIAVDYEGLYYDPEELGDLDTNRFNDYNRLGKDDYRL